MPAGWALGDDLWERHRAAKLDPEAFVIPAQRLVLGEAATAA
jgi:hypothetical protein